MKRFQVHLFSCLVTAMLFALLLAPAVTQAQGTWTAVPSPSTNELHAVTSISANDVWAVGVGPITEHWNGSAWSIVPSPTVTNGKLLGVAAASTSDVWAVDSPSLGPRHSSSTGTARVGAPSRPQSRTAF